MSGWQTATLRFTPGSSPVLNVSVDRSEGGHPEKRDQISIDPNTLQVVRRQPFADLSRGQRWRSWVRFVHTGEAGGWWGETLALLTACGAILLTVTGAFLSLDRWCRYRKPKATAYKSALVPIE